MVVLVTGASSGIGRSLALYYLNQGATVAAVARRADALHAWHNATPGRLALFPIDVTDRAGMVAAIAQIEQTLGPIDLAIASAGIAEDETPGEIDLIALERTLATNVCGTFNVLVPVAAAMRQRGRGQVVAVSSLAALMSLPGMGAYCASKMALEAGMETLQRSLRGSGVGVTIVSPGFITTPMTEARVHPRWCMKLDRAVVQIVRAIETRRRICRFPASVHVLLRALHLLPFAVRSAVLDWFFPRLLPTAPPFAGRVAVGAPP